MIPRGQNFLFRILHKHSLMQFIVYITSGFLMEPKPCDHRQPRRDPRVKTFAFAHRRHRADDRDVQLFHFSPLTLRDFRRPILERARCNGVATEIMFMHPRQFGSPSTASLSVPPFRNCTRLLRSGNPRGSPGRPRRTEGTRHV